MSRMSLCIITSAFFPPNEGIGFYIDGLANALTKRNVAVAILGRRRPAESAHRLSGGEITFQSVPFIPVFPFHSDLAGIISKLRHHRIMPNAEILNFHSPLVPWFPAAIPSTATVHSTMRDGVLRMDHTRLTYVASRGMSLVSSQRIERRLLSNVDAVAASAHHVAQSLSSYPYDVPHSKITVLGNGVDADFFKPNPEKRKEENALFWAGRLADGKGLMNLVKAVDLVRSKGREITLRIAGTGPMEKHLVRAIADAKLSGHIRLLGHLERPEILMEYQRASLFVFDSRFEGLPTVLLEAMACGTPCLCGAIEGVSEMIVDNGNGFLVEPGEPEKFGQKILEVLDNIDTLQKVGEAARASVLANSTWDKVADKYIDFFEHILP